MTYRGPWNAAGWKQRNPSRERKMSTRVMEGGSDRKPAATFSGTSGPVLKAQQPIVAGRVTVKVEQDSAFKCDDPTSRFEGGQRIYPGALVSVDASTGKLVPFNFGVPANRAVGTTYEQLEKGDQVEIDLATGHMRKIGSAVEADAQPMMHTFNCDKHRCQGWSTWADDGCVLCKIDDKAAAVLADMQPHGEVFKW